MLSHNVIAQDTLALTYRRKESNGLTQIISILESLNVTPEIIFFSQSSVIELLIESGDGVALNPDFLKSKYFNPDVISIPINNSHANLNIMISWKKNTNGNMDTFLRLCKFL